MLFFTETYVGILYARIFTFKNFEWKSSRIYKSRHNIITKLRTSHRFSQILPGALSAPRPHPGDRSTSGHVSSVSSDLGQCFSLALFFMMLVVLKSTLQKCIIKKYIERNIDILQNSLKFVVFCCFSPGKTRVIFRKKTSEVKYPSHHIIRGARSQHDASLVLTLVTWPAEYLPGFSYFFTPSEFILWKQVTKCSPYSQQGTKLHLSWPA